MHFLSNLLRLGFCLTLVACGGGSAKAPATTPVPDTTTPVPDTTTPVPDTTTPVLDTTTPVPDTTTPVPDTTTPVLDTTTPVPDTTTPVPDTTTPVPDTTTSIPDTSAPVITLTDNNTISISQGDAFSDPGATAIDDVDNNVTVSVNGEVDTATAGTYILTYVATDTSGNSSSVTRVVNVLDTTAPVITLQGSQIINIAQGEIFTDPKATAIDNLDGVVSVIVDGNLDNSTIGSYPLTYTAVDIAGNSSSATRVVNVLDTTAPVITLLGDASINISQDEIFSDPKATATDNLDGEVEVTVRDNLDNSTVGTYTLTYTAVDVAGNTSSVTRLVNVLDTTKPVILLTGNDVINIRQGEVFSDPGATATDNTNGNVAVSVTGHVDTSALGSYTITYTASDSVGNTSSITRTVNIVDNIAPVITLNGANPLEITVGRDLIDPGAVALDEQEGDVAVTVSGTVDNLTIGNYTLTYTATDSVGNKSTVIRTVSVNEIQFTDDNFLNCIRINLSLNETEMPTRQQLESITDLFCYLPYAFRNESLKIGVISSLKNLQALTLWTPYGEEPPPLWPPSKRYQFNDLTPLTDLNKLEFINLHGFTSNDFKSLFSIQNLKGLIVSGTDLNNIRGIKKLEKLESLELYDNVVSDFSEFSELTSLTNLTMSYSGVSDAGFLSNLSSLRTLNLLGNNFDRISLVDFPNIEEITLTGNNIIEVNFEKLPKLKHLNLKSNDIIDISISNFPELEELYLSYNDIINSSLIKLPKLKVVDLSHNELGASLSGSTNLSSLINLETLLLNDNNLVNVNLSTLPTLKKLNLNNNKLVNINLSNFLNLESLEASNNNLVDLSLIGFPELESLRIRGNKLTEISLSNFPKLKRLILGNDELMSLSLSDFPILPSLLIENNESLTQVSLQNMPALKTLFLRDNQINNLSLSELNELETLWVGGNKLNNLSFILELPSLLSLEAPNNQLKNISVLSFFTELRYLNLLDNFIEEVTPISSLINLRGLELGRNCIHDFSPIFHLHNDNGYLSFHEVHKHPSSQRFSKCL